MTSNVTTMPVPAVHDDGVEARWQAWQARGADGDRRRVGTMRWVAALVGLSLTAWLLLQVIAS